jgi:hypothetical protein
MLRFTSFLIASDKTNWFSKSIRFLWLVVSCENDAHARDLGRYNKAARLGRRRELVLRRAGQVTLQLFIRTMVVTILVRASPNETVRGLQQRLEGGRGLCKGLRLRYQGKDMDESATLQVFQLRDFATLDSLGPLRGGMILGPRDQRRPNRTISRMA